MHCTTKSLRKADPVEFSIKAASELNYQPRWRADAKLRQVSKIREVRCTLEESGFHTLDEQALAEVASVLPGQNS
jgi:hypothetical protein